MTTHFYTRPQTSGLVFQLYGRPVHPEFFDVRARRRVARRNYTLDLWVTRTGHVATWTNRRSCLTELTAADRPPLANGPLLEHPLRGERCDMLGDFPGLNYQVSFQVERLSPDQYLCVHREILAAGSKSGLLHAFADTPRLALSPLGAIHLETRAGGLSLSTFHTFPDELAVVKTQSLIERRP
jgi:hypothetical protein